MANNYELEEACKRGILELILAPLHNKYEDKITIAFPTEVRARDDYILDYTIAHIVVKSEKSKHFLGDAKLHFDFVPSTLTLLISDNNNKALRAGRRNVGYPQHTVYHIALTDPECHLKAIRLISEFIDKFTKDSQ